MRTTPKLSLSTFGFILLTIAHFLLPAPAYGQASRLGDTVPVIGGAIRYPDAAYDAFNDVYLTISGLGPVMGRFIAGDGTPLGAPFPIPDTTAFTMVPRAAWSPDLGGFLVTWLDFRLAAPPPNDRAQVWGRLLRYQAGAPEFLTPGMLIGPAPGGAHGESAASVAYATTSKEFLVAWQQTDGGAKFDIRAQRIAFNGTLLGPEIVLSFDNHWQNLPAVDYDAATDTFFVAWQNYTEPAGPSAVVGRRVQAGTGAVGDFKVLFQGVDVAVPDVSQGNNGAHLVTWLSNHVHYGLFVNAEGDPISGPNPLVVNSASYDAFSVAHNRISNTYFAVFHGPATEDMGVEIGPTGVPAGAPFDVTLTGNRLGNFNPRVAAHGVRPEWMVVTSTGFAALTAQRITTLTNGGPNPNPPPPPPPPPTGPQPSPIDLASAPHGSWFFAEGYASNGGVPFDTYYLLTNPNGGPITVRAYYSNEAGQSFTQNYALEAFSRKTISLRSEMGTGAYGAVFQSMTPGAQILAERSMYWAPNLEGSHSSTGSFNYLGNAWFFAEGSRRQEYFRNFYLVFNPTAAAGVVAATFYLPGGLPPVVRWYDIGPQQRLTIDAASVPELAGIDFSVRIDSSVPTIAERSMYWGSGWHGGTNSLGSPWLYHGWHFAEGASAPGFDTYFTILNPNPYPVDVNVEYYTELVGAFARLHSIPANSRYTVYANAETGPIGGFGTRIIQYNGAPILAERSTYWGTSPEGWVEGSNTIGSTTGGHDWYLPEGSTTNNFETFVLLQSYNLTPMSVWVSVYIEGGGRYTVQAPLVLQPLARQTIYMHDFLRNMELAEGLPFGTLVGKSFSMRVWSADIFVAEHAIYWQRDGANYWRGGSASLGIPVQ